MKRFIILSILLVNFLQITNIYAQKNQKKSKKDVEEFYNAIQNEDTIKIETYLDNGIMNSKYINNFYNPNLSECKIEDPIMYAISLKKTHALNLFLKRRINKHLYTKYLLFEWHRRRNSYGTYPFLEYRKEMYNLLLLLENGANANEKKISILDCGETINLDVCFLDVFFKCLNYTEGPIYEYYSNNVKYFGRDSKDEYVYKIVKTLCEKHLFYNKKINNQLLFNIIYDYPNLLVDMLHNQLDVKIKDDYGNTLLHYVYYSNDAEILMKKGVYLYDINKNGLSVMHTVRNKNVAEILINNGLDIEKIIPDMYGNTFLHTLSKTNDSELLKYLVSLYPKNIYVKNKENKTPFEMLVNEDKKFEENFFILQGEEVYTKYIKTKPIWRNIYDGNKESTINSVQNGASLTLKNIDGKSAQDIINDLGYDSYENFILNKKSIKPILYTQKNYKYATIPMDISLDGKYISTKIRNEAVVLYDAKTKKQIAEINVSECMKKFGGNFGFDINHALFYKNNKFIILSIYDRDSYKTKILFYDIYLRKIYRDFDIESHVEEAWVENDLFYFYPTEKASLEKTPLYVYNFDNDKLYISTNTDKKEAKNKMEISSFFEKYDGYRDSLISLDGKYVCKLLKKNDSGVFNLIVINKNDTIIVDIFDAKNNGGNDFNNPDLNILFSRDSKYLLYSISYYQKGWGTDMVTENFVLFDLEYKKKKLFNGGHKTNQVNIKYKDGIIYFLPIYLSEKSILYAYNLNIENKLKNIKIPFSSSYFDILINKKYFIFGTKDYGISLWDIKEEREIWNEKLKTPVGVSLPSEIATSFDEKYAVTHGIIFGGMDGLYGFGTIWDLEKKEKKDSIFLVTSASFSYDSKYLALLRLKEDKESSQEYISIVEIRKTLNFEIEKEIVLKNNHDYYYKMAYSKDNNILAVISAGTTARIKLYDVSKEEFINEIITSQNAISSINFIDSENILISGDKNIEIINISNKNIRKLLNNTEATSSISISHQKDYFFSSGMDGTVNLWDFKQQKKIGTIVFADEKNENNDSYTFFLTNGFYWNSKKNINDLFHYLVDGKPYLSEQFDLQYNRPDKVLESIGLAPKETIEVYRKAYAKRLKKLGIDSTKFEAIRTFKVPTLSLAGEQKIFEKATQKQYKFQINATDETQNLNRLNVWVNGVPIYGVRGYDLTAQKTRALEKHTITLELSQGNNIIEVSVLNDASVESLKERFEVEYEGKVAKPNLYLFLYGAAQYQFKEKVGGKNWNLSLPIQDCEAIAKLFGQDKNTFANIFIDSLYNEKATVANVMRWKEKLSKARPDDYVIMYASCHGLLDKNYDYYLATYPVNFDNPASFAQNALSYEALTDLLDLTPARQKLLLLDACHSGEVDAEELLQSEKDKIAQNTQKEQKGTASNVKRKGEGEIGGAQGIFNLMKNTFADLRKGAGEYVISASAGTEFAEEAKQWGNGAFTRCLIDEFQAQSKEGKDIHIADLQANIAKRVFELTNGRQNPDVRVSNANNNFVIRRK